MRGREVAHDFGDEGGAFLNVRGPPGWAGGLPHQINLCRSQTAGLVDEVAERALQGQGFGGEGAGGFDGAGVFVPQRVEAGGGQRLLLSLDALYFAYPGGCAN